MSNLRPKILPWVSFEVATQSPWNSCMYLYFPNWLETSIVSNQNLHHYQNVNLTREYVTPSYIFVFSWEGKAVKQALPFEASKWSWGELFIAHLPLVKQYSEILKKALLEHPRRAIKSSPANFKWQSLSQWDTLNKLPLQVMSTSLSGQEDVSSPVHHALQHRLELNHHR